MAPSLNQRLDDLPRRMLGMKGEANPQKVGTPEMRRDLGRAIGRAIDSAGLTHQEISHRMGYADQGQIGKWVNGIESPHFWRLWAVEELRDDLIVALAGIIGRRVAIRTVIEVERVS